MDASHRSPSDADITPRTTAEHRHFSPSYVDYQWASFCCGKRLRKAFCGKYDDTQPAVREGQTLTNQQGSYAGHLRQTRGGSPAANCRLNCRFFSPDQMSTRFSLFISPTNSSSLSSVLGRNRHAQARTLPSQATIGIKSHLQGLRGGCRGASFMRIPGRRSACLI
jgi:hypothetical protein